VIATALAALSFRVLENPIRMSKTLTRHRGAVIAAGFATSVLVAVLFMPAVLGAGNSRWTQAYYDIPPSPGCIHKPVEKCVLVHGGERRMLLIGDSTARMWIPALTEIAKRESLTFGIAVTTGCPWQRGLQYSRLSKPEIESCTTAKTDWYDRIVPQFNPDIVVVVNRVLDGPSRRTTDQYIGPRGEHFTWGDANFEPILIGVSRSSLAQLRRTGRDVVIIEPIPQSASTFDPLDCLSKGKALRECEFRTNKKPTQLERAYRVAADEASDISTINMDRAVCPRLPICDPIIHDDIVSRDGRHLTGTFARSLWPVLDAKLHDAHVLGNQP
jgi:hypothetical protein